MKKFFKGYAIVWTILFTAFNAAVFAVPAFFRVGSIEAYKFDGAFWASYLCISAAFIGNFLITWKICNSEDFNIPGTVSIVKSAWSALILTLIIGVVCMLLSPAVTNVVAAVLCLFIFLIYAISISKKISATKVIADFENNTAVNTSFIKDLSSSISALSKSTENDELKNSIKKLYDTVRFSDPVSIPSVRTLEENIEKSFFELKASVENDRTDDAKAEIKRISSFIFERNEECKNNKRTNTSSTETDKRNSNRLDKQAYPWLIMPVLACAVAALLYYTSLKPMNYHQAVNMYNQGNEAEAVEMFRKLSGYKESEDFIEEYTCKENERLEEEKRLEELERKNETDYGVALKLYESGEYGKAIDAFKELNDYNDSADWVTKSQNALDYETAKNLFEAEEYEAAVEAFTLLEGYEESNEWLKKAKEIIQKDNDYYKAIALYNDGSYQEALTEFSKLGEDYKDIPNWIEAAETDIAYEEANKLLEAGKYEAALAAFKELKDYKDSAALAEKANTAYAYLEAEKLYNNGNYEGAAAAFRTLGNYKDSLSRADEAQNALKYEKAFALYENGAYPEAKDAFEELDNYKDSAMMAESAQRDVEYEEAVDLYNSGKYSEAREIFARLEDYKKSTDYLNLSLNGINYDKAVDLFEEEKYEEAIVVFEGLKDYGDSTEWIEKAQKAIKEREEQYQAAEREAERLAAEKEAEKIAAKEKAERELQNQKQIQKVYSDAIALYEKGEYDSALSLFEELGMYSKAEEYSSECKKYILFQHAEQLALSGKKYNAIKEFNSLESWNNANIKSMEVWDELAQRNTIAAGHTHVAMILKNGTVDAKGNNSQGQCDVLKWTNIVSVSVGSIENKGFTIGLKDDGTVVSTGNNDFGQCNVSDWKNIVSITSGPDFTVGLKSDGTVIATGSNYYGQTNIAAWTDIIAISAGNNYTVGLKADGTVVATGDNLYKQCEVSGLKNIISVSAGNNHSLFLNSNGTVIAIGTNENNECEVNSWEGIVSIAAGYENSLGLKYDGTVESTGRNYYGELSSSVWNEVVEISSAISGSNTLILNSRGTSYARGTYWNNDGAVTIGNGVMIPHFENIIPAKENKTKENQIAILKLGISVSDSEISNKLDGAYVHNVLKKNPLIGEGIKMHDLIVAVDKFPITNARDLQQILNDYDNDEEIEIHIIRYGEEMTIKAMV